MGRTALARARPHLLTDTSLASLGAGRPTPETIAELRRSQLSRHLLLLREIAHAAPDDPHLAALAAAEAADPTRVRKVISRPLFGVWAVGCLTALRAGTAPTEAGLAHLGDLAAAARIPRPRQAGPPEKPADPEDDDRVLRASHDGLGIAVRLEDSDPLRARLGLVPAPRLDDAALRRWRAVFGEAWRLLVTLVPEDARVVAAVLECIVPVESDPAARGISASSADAYGAVAMSEPADATALAVGLLHEAQHSILNAVQYLFDLLGSPATLGYSPWRDDPRPASGILHGAYAYLTVTRFWRAHRAGGLLAQFEFARWRAAVAAAAEGLDNLSPAGSRFVGALLDEVRPWLGEPVDPRVLRLAEGANRDHHLRWRLRNRQIGPAGVAALGRAWALGEAPPPVRSELRAAPRRALEASARLDLAHRFVRGLPLTGSEADLAYVRGDLVTALTAYRKGQPDWPALVLTSGLDVPPEVAAAVPAEADPIKILEWLS
ncbi:aKG-HExxH-type peptide beta-hydroxylase [Actinoplanes sp. NPDC051494]|uniref:aKG-HExxH-type peptide beta-hydroxylase n=1 Tax=Actinoplanes sp. NPDC051494 TaxID=3363907 RepID=UPI0037B3A8E5